MIELPASSLILSDTTGRPFGQLRLVPVDGKPYAEGIFDVAPVDEEQAARSEVRWMCKRHYKRFSEHRLSLGADGSITVKKAGFTWVLDPDEEGDGFTSRAPAPKVRATWASE
jgi:hypothetical protein